MKVVAACVLFVLLSAVQAVILVPDAPLNLESIHNGEVLKYELRNLEPSSFYEVRISYPAYDPAKFSLTFEEVPSPSRKLADVEKLMFTTDEKAHIVGRPPLSDSSQGYTVYVHCERNVPARSADIADRPVVFNIVLETLFMNAPYGVFRIAIIGIVLTLGLYKLIVPLWDHARKQKQ